MKILVLALFLLTGARAAGALETTVVGGVASGGGWDSNVSGAAAMDEAAVSAAFSATRAWAGAALAFSEDDELSLHLGYDGTIFPAIADLNEHRLSATAGWLHVWTPRLALRLSSTVATRSYGDRARDGWDAGATALVRYRLGERLALRVGGAYVRRGASDPAYAWSSGRGKLGIEVDLWPGAFAIGAYALDVGQDTTYDAALVPRPTDRIAHTLSLDVVQPLPSGFFAQLGYAYALVEGELASYRAHSTTAEIGWSF